MIQKQPQPDALDHYQQALEDIRSGKVPVDPRRPVREEHETIVRRTDEGGFEPVERGH
jgi:hypothetical protein